MDTYWYTRPDQEDIFQRIPKVDLHRHLEGSIRLSTLLDLAKTHAIPLPAGPDFGAWVQVQAGDPRTSSNFLAKFKAQHPFYCSMDAIERITAEAVADAAADNVWHLELRFTPTSLARSQSLPVGDVMDRVIASAGMAAELYGISVGLIPSINRHDDPALAEEVTRLALERMESGIAAIDLAGNEADFPTWPFIPALQAARQGGLAVTVHAGEWSGAANVREALVSLDPARIGHGVRILEDPAVVELARRSGTVFEVCITSNYQTGVVPELQQHPLPEMLAAGLNVTINTDDPGISRIRLSDEYRVACQELGIPRPVLYERILAAAQASFLANDQRQALAARLAAAFREIEAAI